MTRFRPLAGFWFLNFILLGVFAQHSRGFRPLAGFWFLNWGIKRALLLHGQVSVPLRGSGS